MFFAESAIFAEFKFVGSCFFIFSGGIILLFAFQTRKRDNYSHGHTP